MHAAVACWNWTREGKKFEISTFSNELNEKEKNQISEKYGNIVNFAELLSISHDFLWKSCISCFFASGFGDLQRLLFQPPQ